MKPPARTITGLERFLSTEGQPYQKARLGLLANQASVGPNYAHALALLDQTYPGAVVSIFGPQHGWAGEKQDNMVESAHGVDRYGRPIFSLYSETRRPTPEMFAGLNALVVDLVDVGTRAYTFAHTLSHCLEEAGQIGLDVLVLDRPNPLGGLDIEGNLLADDCHSFVGLHPIPMRHGLTLGELALFINSRLPKPAPLKIIQMAHWQRAQYFDETGLTWVYPSPNLPTFESAWVYPGQVLWEGTNISEGRGTTRPFTLIGAPFIDGQKLLDRLNALDLPGFKARKAHFQPTFNKWMGQMCQGVELFPVSKEYRPYLVSLHLLALILELWPQEFRLKEPPYEYEFSRRPIDLILGQSDIFNRLAKGESPETLAAPWLDDETSFLKSSQPFLLYE